MNTKLTGLVVATFGVALSALADYTQMDFMTGSGASWVNTGYTPACTDRIEMKVQFRDYSHQQALFCARGANNAKPMMALFTKSTDYKIGYVWGDKGTYAYSTNVFTAAADDGVDHVIVYDGNALKGWVDDSPVAFNGTATYTEAGSVLALFATHANLANPSNYARYRFYYCRIYDKNGTLRHEFVPARDDAKGAEDNLQCGVWDTVDNIFRANKGSRNFDLTGATEVGPLVVSTPWTWTGKAGNSDLTDSANWICTNAAGEVVATGVPNARSTVRLAGDSLALTLPAAAYAGVTLGNCTLAADLDLRAQNEVRVEGAVNLKGRKLYLYSLVGGGMVTDDTAFDLTTADASKVSSDSTFLYSDIKASNLFNDVTPFTGESNKKRVIMSKKNLPMVVDYDFGEPTTIDAYRVWEAALPKDGINRAPSAWTLSGSDDGVTWTKLDSRCSVYWPESCLFGRVLSLDASVTYRKYRLTVTDCPDAVDGYMTLTQLEYGRQSAFGELHIDVPSGPFAYNTDVAITGSVRVFKDGAGTYVPQKAGQSNWSLTVNGGTATAKYSDSSSRYIAQTGAEIHVGPDANAIFELNGCAGFDYYTFVLNGGKLRNATDRASPASTPQVKMLRLNADSEVRFYKGSFIAKGYSGATIDLRGHKLTAVSTENSYFANMHVTEGTLRLEGPWFAVNANYAFSAPQTSVEMVGRLYCGCPVTLGDYLDKTTITRTAYPSGYDNTLTVTGRFQPTTEYFYGCTLADGATLDLTAQTDTWNTSSKITGTTCTNVTFAANAKIAIDVQGRDFMRKNKKLVGWYDTLKPTDYATLTFKLNEDVRQRLYHCVKKDDGIYLDPRGFIITVR